MEPKNHRSNGAPPCEPFSSVPFSWYPPSGRKRRWMENRARWHHWRSQRRTSGVSILYEKPRFSCRAPRGMKFVAQCKQCCGKVETSFATMFVPRDAAQKSWPIWYHMIFWYEAMKRHIFDMLPTHMIFWYVAFWYFCIWPSHLLWTTKMTQK